MGEGPTYQMHLTDVKKIGASQRRISSLLTLVVVIIVVYDKGLKTAQ